MWLHKNSKINQTSEYNSRLHQDLESNMTMKKLGGLEDTRSYAKLPLWSTVLKSNNSGSFTCIEIESNKSFQYYFRIIGASVRGFQYICHVMAVNVTLIFEK